MNREGCNDGHLPGNAAKLGYRVHRSRRRKGRDNAGDFMLIHKASSTVVLGAGFTASLEAILDFIERERSGHESAVGDLHRDAAHP